MTSHEKVLLVTNPASGSSDDVEPSELRNALKALGDVTVFAPSSESAFAGELSAAAEAVELVVVAGGDGSLHHAINALSDRVGELAFALIPLGTGNDLATTLGLPEDPLEAAGAIASYAPRSLDFGRATADGFDRLFVNASVGGFPVEVDEAVEEKTKKRLGPLAFWLGGLKAAAHLQRSTVTVNGTEVADCVAVGVGNGRTAGGGLPIWPRARTDDGLLDACALPASGAIAAVKLAATIKSGRHVELEGVLYERASSIEIGAEPEIEFNLDGELLGLKSPARFAIAGTISMRAPSG